MHNYAVRKAILGVDHLIVTSTVFYVGLMGNGYDSYDCVRLMKHSFCGMHITGRLNSILIFFGIIMLIM